MSVYRFVVHSSPHRELERIAYELANGRSNKAKRVELARRLRVCIEELYAIRKELIHKGGQSD